MLTTGPNSHRLRKSWQVPALPNAPALMPSQTVLVAQCPRAGRAPRVIAQGETSVLSVLSRAPVQLVEWHCIDNSFNQKPSVNRQGSSKKGRYAWFSSLCPARHPGNRARGRHVNAGGDAVPQTVPATSCIVFLPSPSGQG